MRVFYDNTTNTDYIFVAVSEIHAFQRKLYSTSLPALAHEAVDLNVAGTIASIMQRYRASCDRMRHWLYVS